MERPVEERKAKAWEQFKEVNDARLKEIGRKGQADPLHDEQLGRLHEALDAEGGFRSSGFPALLDKAFARQLRNGAFAGQPGVDGDTPAPASFSDRVTRLVHDRSPMRQVARVATIDASTLSLFDSRINAFRDFPTHELYAQPKATQKFLDDSRLDVEGWLADNASDVFARVQNTAFINGTGVGRPRGFLTYPNSTDWGQVQQVGSGAVGQLTSDSLLAAHRSLDDEYRGRASFLTNAETVRQARVLKADGTDHYLWQPSLSAGAPDTLLGVPVYLAADMPLPSPGSLSVALADFKSAYQIVDQPEVRILRDPFSEKPFIKFFCSTGVGGDVADFAAVKLLRLAA